MPLIQHTAPIALPVSLEEAKLHLRVDGDDENSLIEELIGTAVSVCEHKTGRSIMPQAWELVLDRFCSRQIELGKPVVTRIVSVDYTDADGQLRNLSETQFRLVRNSEFSAFVCLADGAQWPETAVRSDAVRIVFGSGYADAASVPKPLKSWIKLMVGALYADREKQDGLGLADGLLDRFRVW